MFYLCISVLETLCGSNKFNNVITNMSFNTYQFSIVKFLNDIFIW